MTIEPEWLGSVIALVLGRKPDTALIDELASLLAAREEVLPWLMLRQGAFADDPEIVRYLRTLAAQANRPSHQRPAGPVLHPQRPALERNTEAMLRTLIGEDVARTDLAQALGATLHHHNRTLPGRPGYDFRRSIVERPPKSASKTDVEEVQSQG